MASDSAIDDVLCRIPLHHVSPTEYGPEQLSQMLHAAGLNASLEDCFRYLQRNIAARQQRWQYEISKQGD